MNDFLEMQHEMGKIRGLELYIVLEKTVLDISRQRPWKNCSGLLLEEELKELKCQRGGESTKATLESDEP